MAKDSKRERDGGTINTDLKKNKYTESTEMICDIYLEKVRTQTKRRTMRRPSSLLAWARVERRLCRPLKCLTSCHGTTV